MNADTMLACHALIQDRPTEEQVQRLAVVQEALTWLGTKYHHAARVRGAGVDCGMLLAEVYEGAGVMPHVVPEDYPPDWHQHQDGERYLALVQQHAHPVDTPLPGDIVLYKFDRCISHGAIVLAWPQILHAYIRLGVVLDEGERNSVLRKAQVGFWSPWAKPWDEPWDEPNADLLAKLQPGQMMVPASIARHLSGGA